MAGCLRLPTQRHERAGYSDNAYGDDDGDVQVEPLGDSRPDARAAESSSTHTVYE